MSAAAASAGKGLPIPLLTAVVGAAATALLALLQTRKRAGKSGSQASPSSATQKEGKEQYGGLVDVVSFSSRMIAASRARETKREGDRLFEDPLAEIFAGEAAMKRSEERAAKSAREGDPSADRGRIAVRTRYFDDALLEALGVIDALYQRPPWIPIPLGWGVKRPRQVVMMGAGMDSRAWRLRLPEGTAWFEVDRGDVLGAKRRILVESGAQLEKKPTSVLDTAPPPHYKHPLMADKYAAVAADLSEPTWTDALVAAGFDPSATTVWLAEGLLMYLPDRGVRSLFDAARKVSAKGSVFLFSAVNEASVRNAKASKSDLMQTWQWGLPDDSASFLEDRGWKQITCVQLGEATASYGRYILTEDDKKRDGKVIYVRAVTGQAGPGTPFKAGGHVGA